MLKPLLLIVICLALLGLSLRLFYNSWRQSGAERVLDRLSQGQPQRAGEVPRWAGLDRTFLRAGLGRPTDRLGVWLLLWAFATLIGFAIAGWIGLLVLLTLPPVVLRLYVSWRYQRRLRRMIEQLPQLLDHTVRSLKS
ncbi:type II secretion system protein F, partial [Pseudomonas sp. HMWF005]